MFRLAILYLVAALAAAAFGFGLVSVLANDPTKVLFVVLLVLAVLSFLFGYMGHRREPRDVV